MSRRLEKPYAVGPYLLSAQSVLCLKACAQGTEPAHKHHSSVIRALTRRGLVKVYTSGSYLTGGNYANYLEITDEGRRIAKLWVAQ